MRPSLRLSTVLLRTGLPVVMVGVLLIGARDSCGQDVFAKSAVLWKIQLGDHQYTVPRVDRDRLLIGVNDTNIDHPAAKSTGGGILMCLDRASGQRIWQLPIPRYMPGIEPPFHFDQWTCGICSSPAVDGNRLYVVSPRGDVLCIDREGQANGNDGPLIKSKKSFQAAFVRHMRLSPPSHTLEKNPLF